MNRVITINLNGNAYQLEEAGYELLKKYLEQARKNLADDPDKDEILADFERAIAEKCDSHLNSEKNVVTEKEVAKIIDDMGPVEPADDSERTPEQKSEPATQPKRLYLLGDGAIIGGVANGLAAYLNIDVTIVRLLFLVLVFVSSGIWILIYLLLMLLLPEARTPEQKAELRGERFSAQDVLGRARQKYADIGSRSHWRRVADQNQPMLSNLGELLLQIVRACSLLCGIVFGILFGLLTATWISGLWWLTFGHVHFVDQLSTVSLWTVGTGATAVYFIAALPLAVLTGSFVRIGARRPLGKQSLRWLVIAACLWVLAVGVVIGVAAVTGGRFSAYQSTHGYIDIDRHEVCINQDICGNNPDGGAYVQPQPIIQPAPMERGPHMYQVY